MKRVADRHPKVLALNQKIDLAKWKVTCLLESLWTWTAKFCPRGDLGKYGADVFSRASGCERTSADVFRVVFAEFVD